MRKRRPRSSRSYFVASAVLAGAAVVLIHGYLSRGAAVARPVPDVAVVVATEPIDRGETMARSKLRLARIPKPYVPPGAVYDISKAAGRVLLAGLSPGEVVTETRLARVRAGPVASLVPRDSGPSPYPRRSPGGWSSRAIGWTSSLRSRRGGLTPSSRSRPSKSSSF